MASVGEDGTIRVMDYLRKQTLVRNKYKAGGSCILWPGRNVDSKMVTLIGGFSDGVVRVMTLDHAEQESEFELKIILLHALKPHKGEVTAMIIDNEGLLLSDYRLFQVFTALYSLKITSSKSSSQI